MSGDFLFFFFFEQKKAYEIRISDWSSDVCSSDLPASPDTRHGARHGHRVPMDSTRKNRQGSAGVPARRAGLGLDVERLAGPGLRGGRLPRPGFFALWLRQKHTETAR